MLSIVGMLDGFACPAAGSVRSVAGMPGAAGSVSSVAGMPSAAGSVAGMPDNCRLCQTVERCKIFESKVLPYCFEKIFDRGRSALILIPQIRIL